MNSLFIAWRPPQPETTGWRPIGRLMHDGGLYQFCYTQGARKKGFRPFPGMENLDQVYESERLFPIFENRLLPKNRPEYESFLRWSGFDESATPDPVVVLGVTEGRRETDAIEVFPCPVPKADHCYANRFFLHGIRWLPESCELRINSLEPGEILRLMPDPQNSADPHAVGVRTESDRTLIGYVPRYLAQDVYKLFQACDVSFIELKVARVNRDAPLQNRLLCQMYACWPEGFRPCDSEDFLPIPSSVPVRCDS